MELPELKYYRQKVQKQIVRFGGINYTDTPGDGELSDSKGLTSSRYPVLSQRGGRTEAGTYTAPTSIFAWDKLCVVDGTDFYYNGVKAGSVQSGEKQWAVVNTKMCFWPDKKYLDVSDPEDVKLVSLDAQVTALAGTVTFTPTTVVLNANPTAGEIATATARSWYSNEEACIVVYDSVTWNAGTGTWSYTGQTVVKAADAVVGKYVIPQYNSGTGAYYVQTVWCNSYGTVPSVSAFDPPNTNGIYGKIKSVTVTEGEEGVNEYTSTYIVYTLYDATQVNAKLTDSFAAGDMVTVSGCATIAANNKSAIVRNATEGGLTFDAGTFTAGSEAAAISIERSVPDLEFICEWDNRLWGVKDKTIYASALGDPRNFEVFENLSTDSYTVAVGTDGDFTGACAYSGSVLFWKEDCLHKIVGSMPSDYYLYTYNITGLQAGSHKSLEIINEVLYYKGPGGIYAYTGGTPELISACFGTNRYTKANAGADGFKYCVSMQDTTGDWHLFVYDTRNNLWLREDDTHAVDFAFLGGALYFLSGTKIYKTDQADSAESVEWLAEFAPFYEMVHSRKRYLRLYLRLELEAGASVKAETRRMTGNGPKNGPARDTARRTEIIPLTMNRCDKFAIRLSGTGACTIRSMVREFQYGSEV